MRYVKLTICLDFKSKKIRVNLNMPIKAEVPELPEDRKYVIQTTINKWAD
jgi:hypothetical protein